MKPKFIFLALLLMMAGTIAFAQGRKTEQPRTAVRFAETFTSLSINDDLTVVLTDGFVLEITIEGNAKAIDAKLMDGQLYLGARNPLAAAASKIFVPAGLLSKVFVNGNGVLQSASVLNHNRLNVYLGGEGKIHLRSTGSVTVETLNDVQFIEAR